jgi:hypothetical protein
MLLLLFLLRKNVIKYNFCEFEKKKKKNFFIKKLKKLYYYSKGFRFNRERERNLASFIFSYISFIRLRYIFLYSFKFYFWLTIDIWFFGICVKKGIFFFYKKK